MPPSLPALLRDLWDLALPPGCPACGVPPAPAWATASDPPPQDRLVCLGLH